MRRKKKRILLPFNSFFVLRNHPYLFSSRSLFPHLEHSYPIKPAGTTLAPFEHHSLWRFLFGLHSSKNQLNHHPVKPNFEFDSFPSKEGRARNLSCHHSVLCFWIILSGIMPRIPSLCRILWRPPSTVFSASSQSSSTSSSRDMQTCSSSSRLAFRYLDCGSFFYFVVHFLIDFFLSFFSFLLSFK